MRRSATCSWTSVRASSGSAAGLFSIELTPVWHPCILGSWNCCSDARRPSSSLSRSPPLDGPSARAGRPRLRRAWPAARAVATARCTDPPNRARALERVVTQAQADSCCAASDTDDSTPSAAAFSLSLSAALVTSTVVDDGAARGAAGILRRVAHPRASPARPGREARPALRLPDLARDSTRVSRRHIGGLARVARAAVCARSVVHDQSTHRTVAAQSRSSSSRCIVALAGWGWWALQATPIDAIPDLSDNQVIVFTDWPGHSPQEVEDQVTYPLTVNLQGLAGVRVVRSQSAFGFSMIYVVFEDNVDLYFARARVLERMSLVAKALPAGVVPTLGPDATGVGHVFWYTVESPTLSLRELRTPAGLVHPLPAQRRARRRRSRVGRRLRPAVPDRRRSQPAARLQPAAQRGRRGGPRQQPERRRQRARVERRLV